MTGGIARFDDAVDRAFEDLRGKRAADRLFYGASFVGEFSLIWVMAALARALRGGRRHERAAIRALVFALLESLLVNWGLKSIVKRRRPPPQDDHPHPFRQPLTSSFPSGHASAAFCEAVLLSEDDVLGPLYFTAASVVAASRIHTGIHHASDVVGGVAIGTAIGLIGRRLMPLGRPGVQG